MKHEQDCLHGCMSEKKWLQQLPADGAYHRKSAHIVRCCCCCCSQVRGEMTTRRLDTLLAEDVLVSLPGRAATTGTASEQGPQP